jgi:hypothetical protein
MQLIEGKPEKKGYIKEIAFYMWREESNTI